MIICIANFKGGKQLRKQLPRSTSPPICKRSRRQSLPTVILCVPAASGLRAERVALPFKVVPIGQLAKHVRQYEHVVVDTEANPSDEDFKDAAQGCDLLVIPAEPETTATDGLTYTLSKLRDIKHDRFRVLLTKVPPPRRPRVCSYAPASTKPGFPSSNQKYRCWLPTVRHQLRCDSAGSQRRCQCRRRRWLAYEKVGREIING